MHPSGDFLVAAQPTGDDVTDALVADLGLDLLFDAMGDGDAFVADVGRQALLHSLQDPEAVVYRQGVLRDCLAAPAAVRQLYDLAVGALDAQRKVWRHYTRSPEATLRWALAVLGALMEPLRALRRFAADHAADLSSVGFRRFFAMVEEELDDEYLDRVATHLALLQFPSGLLMSARLGPTNRGADHVTRVPLTTRSPWRRRLGLTDHSGLSFTIAERDDGGIRALGELRDRALAPLAGEVAQSAEHVVGFFQCLRTELAFHLGCSALASRLGQSVPQCFPTVAPVGSGRLGGRGLCDPGLALRGGGPVVANDLQADGRSMVVVTGANQGGKSTFLRSVGIAQLMAQAGMFVAAESWETSARCGVFTHFTREEDTAMTSGKLDEELRRMSTIVDRVGGGSMVLSNESFSSTNEREGSEIARQVITALASGGVTVLAVTHLFDFADGLRRRADPATLFLRAPRQQGGQRTYRLIVADPLPTSFGRELFEREFGVSPDVGPTEVAVAVSPADGAG